MNDLAQPAILLITNAYATQLSSFLAIKERAIRFQPLWFAGMRVMNEVKVEIV